MSKQIHRMFSRIARRYDRANRWMSFGTDQSVRRKAVRLSAVRPGESVLDCAAGTGDLTLLFARSLNGAGRVVGTDFNADMLALAAEKSAAAGAEIEWREQDAQALDFPDESFDVVSIGYGIRSVDEPVKALAEMHRVLRPGGRLVVLEFGQPTPLLRPGYLLFNRFVIPIIGGLIGGDRDAYRYLQRSSDQFPYGDEFVALLEQAGPWSSIQVRPVIFGVNWIYVAERAGTAG